MTPANMSYQPCKGTLGKVRRRQESIKKAAGKLRNSLGLRSETSTRVSLRLSQLRCAGGPTERLLRAGSSCQEQLGFGPAICPATCAFSVFPPSPKAEDSDASSLFSSSLAPSARRREWPAAADPAQALPLPQPSEHTMGPEAGLQHSSDDAGGSPGDAQLPPWPPTPPPYTPEKRSPPTAGDS